MNFSQLGEEGRNETVTGTKKKKIPSCCVTKASETLQLNWAPKQVIF